MIERKPLSLSLSLSLFIYIFSSVSPCLCLSMSVYVYYVCMCGCEGLMQHHHHITLTWFTHIIAHQAHIELYQRLICVPQCTYKSCERSELPDEEERAITHTHTQTNHIILYPTLHYPTWQHSDSELIVWVLVPGGRVLIQHTQQHSYYYYYCPTCVLLLLSYGCKWMAWTRAPKPNLNPSNHVMEM